MKKSQLNNGVLLAAIADMTRCIVTEIAGNDISDTISPDGASQDSVMIDIALSALTKDINSLVNITSRNNKKVSNS